MITASGTGGGTGTIEITGPNQCLPTTTITVTVNATNSVLAGVTGGNGLQSITTAQNNKKTDSTTKKTDSNLNINKR